MIFDFILFVFFGQKTVCILRKNPATRDFLGIEPIGGWDIFHVANTFCNMPVGQVAPKALPEITNLAHNC
jgi:hypothetical protein